MYAGWGGIDRVVPIGTVSIVTLLSVAISFNRAVCDGVTRRLGVRRRRSRVGARRIALRVTSPSFVFATRDECKALAVIHRVTAAPPNRVAILATPASA